MTRDDKRVVVCVCSSCHRITRLVCVYTDRLGKREGNNNFDLPPTLQRTPRFHHHEKKQIILVVGYYCYVDKLNDWPRSGDSDIPPVTHARDLRSAPVAPLIPYVSIRMLDSL